MHSVEDSVNQERRNILEQFRITGGVMEDSFDSQSNLSSNTQILEKLKEQIATHEDEKYKVDIEHLRAIYRKFDRDRTKHDY